MKLGFLILWFLSGATAAAAALEAGLSRIEITPPVGYVMGGYSARQGGSTGVHDPLYATALVLRSPHTSVALVTLDLRSFPSERAVKRIQDELGIEHVMLCSTHTHSGPLTWEDKSWPSTENSWFTQTEDRIVSLAAAAAESTFPARIKNGIGNVYLGHNRRLVQESGPVTMLWRNEEKRTTAPIDPRVRIVQLTDSAGQTRAVLVNHATHPVILGPDNRKISADWPGVLRDKVEAAIPGSHLLFLQGACGDINPYLDKQPVDRGGFQAVEEAGTAIAEEVLRTLKAMERAPFDKGGLQARGDRVNVPHRWQPDSSIPVGLITVLLGDKVALAGWPGEAFVDFQISLADRSPISNTLFCGYCFSTGGVWGGYFPTLKAASEGGYGASYNTTVAVGTGEKLVRLSLRRLYEMIGLLSPLPAEGR